MFHQIYFNSKLLLTSFLHTLPFISKRSLHIQPFVDAVPNYFPGLYFHHLFLNPILFAFLYDLRNNRTCFYFLPSKHPHSLHAA